MLNLLLAAIVAVAPTTSSPSVPAVVQRPQAGPTYTRFLVPMLVHRVPGAHGSLWTADLWLMYTGTTEGFIIPPHECGPIECGNGAFLDPHWPPQPFRPRAQLNPPLIVHVTNPEAADITFQSRLRDLSRDSATAGTEVPVVREDFMFSKPLHLMNIPLTPLFRNTLRVYAFPEVEAPEVEVQYYRTTFLMPGTPPPITLLHAERVRLHWTRPGEFQGGIFASWAERSFDALPQLRGETNVWIKVVPLNPALRFWSMVSITNNDTQQVTLVTPMAANDQ